MNKKMSLTLIAIGLGMSLSNIAAAQEKLIVYTLSLIHISEPTRPY